MSLAKTRMQDLRVTYPSQYDRDELRQTQTGLLYAAIQMTSSASSIISPDLRQKAEVSQVRNLDIPVMKKGLVTISNVRSCTIGGGESESDMIRVVWKTLSVDILMIPARYETNEISYMTDFNRKITEIVEALLVEIESDIDTALDAAKTQVYNSPIATTRFTVAGGAIQVPEEKQKYWFNNLDAINFADDFYNPTMRVIASHGAMPMVSWFVNQGKENAENTAFQFAGKNFTFSNRVTNDADSFATGYFMPDGSLGLLTRVDVDARLGHVAGDGTEWFEDIIPGMPFPVGVQYKSKCSDQHLLEAAGYEYLTATKVEHWQISFDYAILTPYNSDPATKASAIRKFEFVEGVTP